ncbi:pyrroline-5-carboxylate reductase [Aeromicrobium phragmitis]|uniref:Pyrroline-5-carboxylate reductase n=1 Tax=Aeromicrobium phragmitis TaxID=2478914 RepID=A0A3L8PNC8_9ACTN|nr:pyrroline-5-carboxylate reductase [Aeromicrobium phragmitis]RLV56926.1 pyrroline-5-carboxylate reductase [Aeromicrobium phragmitis]
MKVAILGLGSITRGILAALEQAPEVTEVVATRRAPGRREGDPEHAVMLFTDEDPAANRRAVAEADVVFVCVKPHQFPAMLEEIAPVLEPASVVVSVAAGVSFSTLRRCTGPDPRLVRLMPNTPTGVGEGVVGLLTEHEGSEEHTLLAEWFSRVGYVVPLPNEDAVNVLSAVSGSGPAYVFRLAEAMTNAALDTGMSADHAEAAVRQTIIGAAALLKESRLSAEELRRRVTSPGGTTERAVAVLESASPDALFTEAFAASVRHARTLDRS